MVETLGYEALGQWHEVNLLPLNALDSRSGRGPRIGRRAVASLTGAPTADAAGFAPSDADDIVELVRNSPVLRTRVSDPSNLRIVQGKVPVGRVGTGVRRRPPTPMSTYNAVTLATQTVIAQGLQRADFTAARKFGAWVVEEISGGTVLFGVDTVERAFDLAKLLLQREVGLVTPNFIRRYVNVRNSVAPAKAWSHAMIGVSAAWDITKGTKDVKVAVLDEGVDTSHPALRSAVVAERDFIGGNGNSAMPQGNDAHGTACAGIVLSRDKTVPGIAPNCSLIAARIGYSQAGREGWVGDDLKTTDAIRWARSEGAAVLSISWGGSVASNAIINQFALANKTGRGGLGSVVVIAAGNDERPIDFPGYLPGYVTVGASNPDDERKTFNSSDGEKSWGSNYGATMTLLAPGVFISTTDIAGSAGYGPGDFTKTFNGTSSATPAVAAAAALMISVNPALSAASVRDLLGQTAQPLKGQTAWTQEFGWGRLDVAKAVAAARSAGTGLPATAAATTGGRTRTTITRGRSPRGKRHSGPG
jgi:thermitase